jgi:hypothetical protein
LRLDNANIFISQNLIKDRAKSLSHLIICFTLTE